MSSLHQQRFNLDYNLDPAAASMTTAYVAMIQEALEPALVRIQEGFPLLVNVQATSSIHKHHERKSQTAMGSPRLRAHSNTPFGWTMSIMPK
jgi:hypothetical protein